MSRTAGPARRPSNRLRARVGEDRIVVSGLEPIPVTGGIADRFATDGFVVVERIITDTAVEAVKGRFDCLFRGEFETGIRPDEVNWQEGTGDPTLTRQLCNVWKADRLVASRVLAASLGEALARLAGWPGARIVQDNLLWKPPGARSVGFHRDNAYLSWYRPQEMATCWIALDPTSAERGTVAYARGSHRWSTGAEPAMVFHAPQDHRGPMEQAAAAEGVVPDVVAVEVLAGGGSFHHGWTWHGSDANRSEVDRRALVLHCASSEARFHRPGFAAGTGPIYSRYARPDDEVMDEKHFPILWREDGYRTPGLPDSPV